MALIECINKAPKRSHTVAGKTWAFARASADAPLLCEVDDSAAIAIFLSPRNSNVFRSYGPLPSLKRNTPPDNQAQAIKEAIDLVLSRRGQPEFADDLTSEGIPNCNTLSKLCGFTVKKDAMLDVWNAMPPPADAVIEGE